jgi:hypothetical protein
MALDINDVVNLSQEQKEAIAMILRDIEDNEPFGPGVSADYTVETRESLRLTKPSESLIQASEIHRRLQLVPELKRKLHEVTNSNGIPVYTITGSLEDFDKLLNIE